MDRIPCFELGGGGSIPSGPANKYPMKPNLTQENLSLLYKLSGGQPYRPPSYTAITEFTPSFGKLEDIQTKFYAEPPLPQPQYVPEAPYPRIYTKHYKKTILASL